MATSALPGPVRVPATYYQRDWVLACQEERSYFTTPLAWTLDGELDVGALRGTLRWLTARHESLRTSFQVRGTDVQQVVWPEVELALRTVDLSDDPAQTAMLDARILAETERPRVVSVAPLWHGLLFRLAPRRHVLALFVHHLVFDGWSHGVLHDELVRCYRAVVTGRQPRLPQLRLQPGDFAQWERGRRDQDAELWWRDQLRALPPISAVPPVAGRFVSVTLPSVAREATVELCAAAATDGIGSSTTLLAALFAARRAAAGDDLIVGVTRSGRERPQLQRIVGPLLDHVPVRVDLSGAATFRELLHRVNRAYRTAVAHQLPLGLIRQVVPDDLTPRGGRLHDTRFNYLPHTSTRSGVVNVAGGELSITPRGIDPTSLAPRHTEEHPEVLPLSYVLRHHNDGTLDGEICGHDQLFSTERLSGLADEFAELIGWLAHSGVDRPMPALAVTR